MSYTAYVNSIRGFIENSLQQTLMTAIITEYLHRFPSLLSHNPRLLLGSKTLQQPKKTTNYLGLGIGFAYKLQL
jgi:hypothetical protein